MAYKFNVGTFNIKGAIDMSSATSVAHKDLSVATADLAADAVDGTKLADDAIDSEHYTNGSIDGAHIADNAIDSQHYADVSIDAAHIADNAVTLAKMAGLARGKIIVGDAAGNPSALGVGADGKILVADGFGDPSWTTMAGDATISGGTLTIADNAIDSDQYVDGSIDLVHMSAASVGTNQYVTGSVVNVHLVNDGITICGTDTSLGGSIAASVIATAIDSEDMAITGLTDLDVKQAGNITILDTVGGNTLTVGAASTTVSIAGNLTVAGTTTTINSTDLSVDDRIIRIGDGLADLAAGVTATAGFEIGNNLASIKLNTNVNGSGLDGFESSLPFKATSFHGNGAGLTGISANTANAMRHSMSNITASNTISAVGMVICNLQPSTAGILTISGSFQSGDQILVKAGSNVDTTATLTVTGAAGYGYNFDGSQEVVLESPRAGFTLIYDGDAPNALWHIM